MKEPIQIETARLWIKPTNLDDASFICQLQNTEGWINNIGDRGVRTVQDAERYITDKMLPQLKRDGYSNYTVIRKDTNIPVGVSGLYDRDGIDGYDIGYAMLPDHCRQGLASEATKALVHAAFEKFEITHLSAITSQHNVPSKRLLEKLGFKFVKNLTLQADQLCLYEITNPSVYSRAQK